MVPDQERTQGRSVCRRRARVCRKRYVATVDGRKCQGRSLQASRLGYAIYACASRLIASSICVSPLVSSMLARLSWPTREEIKAICASRRCWAYSISQFRLRRRQQSTIAPLPSGLDQQAEAIMGGLRNWRRNAGSMVNAGQTPARSRLQHAPRS